MSPSGKDLYAGTALFLTCYYVLSVNPAILQGAGMPVSIALLGTFLAIILGNLSGVFFTGSGLIIAPAIGISAFFATYVGNTDLVWQQGLFACAIAGLLLAGTSFFTDLRSRIVEELPFSVKLGAKGAIGSLLVASGIKLMVGEIGPNLPEKTVTLVGVGCVTILFLGMVIRNNVLDAQRENRRPGWGSFCIWNTSSHWHSRLSCFIRRQADISYQCPMRSSSNGPGVPQTWISCSPRISRNGCCAFP